MEKFYKTIQGPEVQAHRQTLPTSARCACVLWAECYSPNLLTAGHILTAASDFHTPLVLPAHHVCPAGALVGLAGI